MVARKRLRAPNQLYVVEYKRGGRWIYVSVHNERALARYEARGFSASRIVTYRRVPAVRRSRK